MNSGAGLSRLGDNVATRHNSGRIFHHPVGTGPRTVVSIAFQGWRWKPGCSHLVKGTMRGSVPELHLYKLTSFAYTVLLPFSGPSSRRTVYHIHTPERQSLVNSHRQSRWFSGGIRRTQSARDLLPGGDTSCGVTPGSIAGKLGEVVLRNESCSKLPGPSPSAF